MISKYTPPGLSSLKGRGAYARQYAPRLDDMLKREQEQKERAVENARRQKEYKENQKSR